MRKILFGLLGLLFTIPSFANCNLTQRIINKTYTGVGSSVGDENAIISGITYKENTPYTITIDVEPSDITFSEHGNLLWWSIQYTDNTYDYTGVTTGNYNNGRISVTTAANKTVSSITGLSNHQRWTGGTLKVSNLKIEEGSSATPYQPYDAECVERCKNLFDAQIEKGGVQFTDGRLLSSPNRVRTGTFIDVTPNTTYTISTNMYNVAFFEYDSAGNYVSDSNTLRSAPVTFTTKENTTKVRFSFALQDTSAEVNVNDVQWVQLEQGDTATAYVPYHLGCHETNIKVATTKYTETVFNPLNTALQSAISVVDSVVSNTITQAGSIATLQSGKQTRPADETCPAYKQCLLVEDENGTPHWYQITDPFRDFVAPIIANNVNAASTTHSSGFTQLEYIESTGTQYIDTGVKPDSNYSYELKFSGYAIPTSSVEHIMFGETSSNWVTMVGINQSKAGSRSNVVPYIKYDGVACSLAQQTNGILKLTPAGLYFNGDLVYSKIPDSFGAETYSIYLFAVNYKGTASSIAAGVSSDFTKYRLENFKVWNNNTLVRDMVPVRRNSDNELGMYDLVSGTFFGNAASSGDDFTPGPIVENDADVPGMTWFATWAADATTGVSAGTVTGEGLCNGVSGTYATAVTSSQLSNANWNTTGMECWCKVSGLTVGGEYNVASSSAWVFYASNGSTANCAYNCAYNCAHNVRGYASFRSAVFGM
ncbi:MAG: hypothetical protein ACLRFM_01745 [Alphaproteobacteria bacterium]